MYHVYLPSIVLSTSQGTGAETCNPVTKRGYIGREMELLYQIYFSFLYRLTNDCKSNVLRNSFQGHGPIIIFPMVKTALFSLHGHFLILHYCAQGLPLFGRTVIEPTTYFFLSLLKCAFLKQFSLNCLIQCCRVSPSPLLPYHVTLFNFLHSTSIKLKLLYQLNCIKIYYHTSFIKTGTLSQLYPQNLEPCLPQKCSLNLWGYELVAIP